MKIMHARNDWTYERFNVRNDYVNRLGGITIYYDTIKFPNFAYHLNLNRYYG